MKTKIYSILAAGLAATAMLSSCDNWTPPYPAGEEGTLNMQDFDLDKSEIMKVVSIEAAPKSRADETSVDVNNFIVRILDASGAKKEEWTFSSTPEVITLTPGAYKVEVLSHEVAPAEWEKPYFYVSKDFTIVANAIERLGSLTAKLANSAVSVRFDDELLALCADDVQVEVKANDEGTLTYTPDEVRKGYFKILEGSNSIVVTFSGTVNGYKEKVVIPASDLEAGQHRIYTFKARVNPNPVPDETGKIDGSGILIDTTVTDEDVDGEITLTEDIQDSGDRPGQEEDPEPGPGPDDPQPEVAVKFNLSDDLLPERVYNYNEFGDGSDMAPGTKQAKLTIECAAKIADIEVDIVSDYLTDEFLTGVGLAAHFSLATPGDFETALAKFGFPVKDGVIGQPSVDFNITSLVPLLALSGDPEMKHSFRITVTDLAGKKGIKTLTFDGQAQ